MCQVRLARLLKPLYTVWRFSASMLVADARQGAGTRLVTAEAADDRALFGVVEVVVARSGRDGQHLGNDVEIQRGEKAVCL